MSDDYTLLPSVEDTAIAVSKISEVHKTYSAAALKTLAERLIVTVCDVDHAMGVSQYLRSIKIELQGGRYTLTMDDIGTGLDTEALAREIEAGLVDPGFDKQLRSIQLADENAHEPNSPP